ncbi:hypothetical protein CAPTEDRAFT_214677 [Capitella teleta]|uniref:Uncharacterized protein n=1 Tax=Capitella teleta TaxID=283909 RepID=R7UG45_CAPTE|nr:hypothetical protein CAPTEDRAFT_214677 [Capitella teleta]|eukprot:ELU05175.1 hypothetical protein CAPTEDRAFT_214677 [Capitella teleta]
MSTFFRWTRVSRTPASRMPYDKFFGGAVALSTENMKQMNPVSQTSSMAGERIGKSYMVKQKDEGNPVNPNRWARERKVVTDNHSLIIYRDIGYEMKHVEYLRNGINSVKYTKHIADLYSLYTRIFVSIGLENKAIQNLIPSNGDFTTLRKVLQKKAINCACKNAHVLKRRRLRGKMSTFWEKLRAIIISKQPQRLHKEKELKKPTSFRTGCSDGLQMSDVG